MIPDWILHRFVAAHRTGQEGHLHLGLLRTRMYLKKEMERFGEVEAGFAGRSFDHAHYISE